jgi:hypothetical protein
LSVNLGLTRGHGSLLLDLMILPGRRQHFHNLALSGLLVIQEERGEHCSCWLNLTVPSSASGLRCPMKFRSLQ